MPRIKLTDRTVAAKKITVAGGPTIHLPPSEGVVELWDIIVPGLALRIGYGGKRTYTVTTRINGQLVRRRAGTTDTHTLAEARDVARDILSEAHKGNDPYSKQAKERNSLRDQQEAARSDALTFGAVAAAWLNDPNRRGGANLKSRLTIEQRLAKHVYPVIGALRITDIGRSDIRRLVGEIAILSPVVANRVLADVRRVFHFGIRTDLLDASPTAGVDPPGVERSRDRVLSDGEIAKVWRGFDALGYPYGSVLKLLLLTGARRSEAAALEWTELDGGNWTLPAARAKNGLPHIWPLSTMARDLLEAVPHIDGSRFLFPAPSRRADGIDRPVCSWSATKMKLDRLVAEEEGEPVAPWRIHDLRRTVVTGLHEALGIQPHVVEATIGHMSGSARAGVAGIYNRSEYLEQRKAALERWGQHVEEITSGGKRGNVEQLKPRKRSA